MGYTTTFDGRFECYRVESPMLGEFLRAIQGGDQAALPACADWLIDHDDPRGAQISQWLADGAKDRLTFWRLFGLRPEHAAYLLRFARTRRMKRDSTLAAGLPDPVREAVGMPIGTEGGYFVGAEGFMGQDRDEAVQDYNHSPTGQPGLWCQWMPTGDGTAIVWNGAEKFYHYVEWIQYLIDHFLAPWGYVLNGEVEWQGEDDNDFGILAIIENVVQARRVY